MLVEARLCLLEAVKFFNKIYLKKALINYLYRFLTAAVTSLLGGVKIGLDGGVIGVTGGVGLTGTSGIGCGVFEGLTVMKKFH